MTPTDLFGRPHVQAMRTNILLAFAMNLSRTMSPSELMSCLRLPPRHYATLVFRDAINEMAQEGEIELRAWSAGGCRIPAIRPSDTAKLPCLEASSLMTRADFKIREESPYPRVRIPERRAQYLATQEDVK